MQRGVVRCFDADTVLRVAAGTIGPCERAAIERHLDGCWECQRVVGAAARGVRDEPAPVPPRDAAVAAARYAITREVGRGSMGFVYEALDLELSTVVALKVLTPYLAQIPEVVDRLRREIVLGRRVTHPGVCRLFDLGRVDDTFFISMEFVEGWTLDRIIAKRDHEVGRAIEIGLELFDALEAIHRARIVHRDLKPGNVMLRPDGRVVVLDLGLAGDLAAGEVSSVRVGTPSFWSPEQELGMPATPRSDVYSAGRVLEKLLRAAKGEASAAVMRVVDRCLAHDPAERFASAGAARHALLRALRPPLRVRRAAITRRHKAFAAREEIPRVSAVAMPR